MLKTYIPLSIIIVVIIMIICIISYIFFNRFYAGKTINEVVNTHKRLFKHSNLEIMLKDNTINKNYLENQKEYINIIKQGYNVTIQFLSIGGDFLSVDEVTNYLKHAIYTAKENNVRVVLSQPSETYNSKAEIIKYNIANYALSINYTKLYVTFQVYRKESINDIYKFIKKYNNFIGIRLVKGKFLDEDYFKNTIYNNKEIIQNEYINIAKYLHDNNVKVFYATHDRYLINYIINHDLYDKTLNSFQFSYGYDNSLDNDYKGFNQDVLIIMPHSVSQIQLFLTIIYYFFMNHYWYNI